MTNKAQRYIPDILEDILKELKKLNTKNTTGKIEMRPMPEDKPKMERKTSNKSS